jgi:hypothetical protein
MAEPDNSLEARMRRREEYLDRMHTFLKEEGRDAPSDENAVTADVTVRDEMDAWQEDGSKWRDKLFDITPESQMEGFIIRARREALHAVLNTDDIMRRTRNMEKSVALIGKRIEWIFLFSAICAAILVMNFVRTGL